MKTTEQIPVNERHYRVQELGKIWGVGRNTITRIFGDEPGVLKFGCGRKRVLSIPESVATRVHRELSNRPQKTDTQPSGQIERNGLRVKRK